MNAQAPNNSYDTHVSTEASTTGPFPDSQRRCFTISTASTSADILAIRDLFESYATWLAIDLSFQNYEHELATLPGAYAPPHGALLLARDCSTGEAVGCVALRPLSVHSHPLPPTPAAAPPSPSSTTATPLKAESKKYAELKRLYVLPCARGRGLGNALMAEAIRRAKEELKVDAVKMDTAPKNREAMKLYRKLGFGVCEPYYWNPVEGIVFLELGVDGVERV